MNFRMNELMAKMDILMVLIIIIYAKFHLII